MLVGSSSSNKSGLEKSALANAILILHPPENFLKQQKNGNDKIWKNAKLTSN